VNQYEILLNYVYKNGLPKFWKTVEILKGNKMSGISK
jgi:hypothetical protein